MKTIIAGSRSITDFNIVSDVILKSGLGLIISEVVSGTANGVDKLGEKWAYSNDVPVKRFPADWDKYGTVAGYIRNEKMADYTDCLIAIWDGKSKGTENMIKIARQKRLKIYTHKEENK